MKGNNGELETKPHQHQHSPSQRPRIGGVCQPRRQARQVEMPGTGIDQRHAKQQERRRGRRQNQVLDAGFQRPFCPKAIGQHAVEGHRQQLQADEQGRQMVAGHQPQCPGHRTQEQQVKLFLGADVTGEVMMTQGDRDQRTQEHQHAAH